MTKLKIGDICQVSDCTGIASLKIGKIVQYDYNIYWSIPGVYKPFDHTREFLLQDSEGYYFSMFKDRLHKI